MKKLNVTKKFKNEYWVSSTYKKLLCSLLIIAIIAFVLFTAEIVNMTQRSYKETLTKMQDQLLSRSYETNQIVLKDIVSNCYSLLDSPELSVILYGKDYDTQTALNAQKYFNSILQSSSLVTSVYFINFRTDTIIDQTSRSSISMHQDQEIISFIKNLTPSNSPVFCYPRYINLHYAVTDFENKPILSTIFYQNKYGALVVNIDYETYANFMSVEGNEYVSLYLTDSTGHMIYATNDNLFANDISEEEWYKLIDNSDKNRGTLTYKDNDSNYSIKYIKNEGFGITYVCALKKSFIYIGNEQLTQWIIPIIAFLLITLTVSFILSWIIYSPMRKLRKFILSKSHSSNSSDITSINDFSYITEAFEDIDSINKKLEQESRLLKNKKSDNLLSQLLLQPDDTLRHYTQELDHIDASFEAQNYRIILCMPDPKVQNDSKIPNDSLLRYAIENVTGELLSESCSHIHTLNVSSESATFLCNLESADTKAITDAIKKSQEFIELHYNYSFTVGISENTTELSDLHICYQQAQQAALQRFFTGNGTIHYADDVTHQSANHAFNYELTERIISSIRSFNSAEICSGVQEFITDISSEPIGQIICNILLLTSKLEEIEKQNYIDIPTGWDYAFLNTLTLPIIENNLIERCHNDSKQIYAVKSANSRNNALMKQVLEMVEEQIENPNLSVAYLADQVHLSVNYLRNLFKEATGESLSSYITEKKLARICDLLENTDLSLNDISDRLGFTTKNYFFTFFKKHKKMTPGEYRIQVKNVAI